MSSTNRKAPATVADLVDAIGRQQMQEVCNVGPKSIDKAVRDGMMPARWIGPLKELEEAGGVPVPLSLFRYHRRPGGGRPRVRKSLDVKS